VSKVYGSSLFSNDCFAVGIAIFYMVHETYPYNDEHYRCWSNGSFLS